MTDQPPCACSPPHRICGWHYDKLSAVDQDAARRIAKIHESYEQGKRRRDRRPSVVARRPERWPEYYGKGRKR